MMELSSHTFERSLRRRSTIITFSARSFSDVRSACASSASSAGVLPRGLVPLIGCVSTLPLRQDKKRTLTNKRLKETYRKLVKAAKVSKSKDSVSKAFQAIDKAAKNNIMHKNKAARMKSSLSKILANKTEKKVVEKLTVKKVAVKKTAVVKKKSAK